MENKDLENRLNYLKEVSSMARLTWEDSSIGIYNEDVYGVLANNIITNYGVTPKEFQTDYKIRQYQYSGLNPRQLNMDLGYGEDKIIGDIK